MTASAYRPMSLLRASVFAPAAALLLVATQAHAVPAFSRQTGAECAACHVGGFGPQLTPYGSKFKIGGYSERNGNAVLLPLSAMVVTNATRTEKKAPEADQVEHFDRNDNVAMQEASVFLAGRLAEGLGAFVQETYSGVDRAWAFDQADLRFAKTYTVDDTDTTIGVSINSNPTLTDPFNTLGQWRYPYTSSDFNVGFGPSPAVENLASGVAGVNLYGLYDGHLYAEFGIYDTLSRKQIDWLNGEDAGKFNGMGNYMRVAWMEDHKRDNWSVGLFGFDASVEPERNGDASKDDYHDLGIDASYQFLGNRQNIWTVNGSYTLERSNPDFSDPGENGRLQQFRLAGSYHYNQTWGATLGVFDTWGRGSALYEGDGSLNGKPDSRGFMLQADWTPWGKEGSWGSPWANLRLGVQYVGYDQFMGGSRYLDADGAVRDAKDNNTLSVFAWFAI
jgi:hypothetical protein